MRNRMAKQTSFTRQVGRISAVALFCALLCAAAPARAATVRLVSAADLANRAHKIFYGTVNSVRSFWDNDRIITQATVRVLEPLKGVSTGQVLTVSYPGGVVGKIGEYASCSPDLKKDEHVVLYLETSGAINVTLGRTLGVYHVRSDPGSGRQIATRDITQLGLVVPPGSTLDPDKEPRIRSLFLDDLLREIRGDLAQNARGTP
jgi:hypothetical protein